ncbi:MAG: 2-amino-4-hydroxy-6-hydroxymethyldihydropteridine diphosphokinase [Dissulfurimicrobium sp.]|uniref:2-amino-4-hydroxy-6- hydroxymethyldihydropteridine diphosphokinase n=1 Tax=Dissulfurimicrobium sp. TaxID=2022436 RepID=UPI00404AD08E
MEWKRAYIGLGANLGPRRRNCLAAIKLLEETPGIKIIAKSRFYETEPVGVETARLFVNAVAGIETYLPPHSLLERLLEIEHELGRDRSKGPDRTIDLDLLYYEGVQTDEDDLTLPHPRAFERRFVLAPWAAIAPDLIIAPKGGTVALFLSLLPDGPLVRVMDEERRP